MISAQAADKAKQLRKEVQTYAKSEHKISVRQLINTLVPLFLLWTAAYASAMYSLWIAAACAILSAGFVVRAFIIFHDCTHGSFFKNKKANDIVGNITGIITSFPYEKWKREHSIHHASSSNLDKRGIGDLEMLTVEEYYEKTPFARFVYRMYRNPIVMFGLGPLFLVLIQSRWNNEGARKKEILNTYMNNAVQLLVCAGIILAFGWQAFLVVHGITLFVAGSLGIWLFYIQHTFEDSYFEYEEEWDYVKAAVEGSSFYKLPRLLQWITGNIGYHHVHHLAPRIPNYYLQEAHETVAPLQKATTITLKESFASIGYKLYDHQAMKFVSFAEARYLYQHGKYRQAA